MATSPANANRVFDGQVSMLRVNSYFKPENLGDEEISWGFNLITRNGNPRSRPGFDSLFKYTCGKAQGGCFFRPTGGIWYAVLAISGSIFALPYPFDTFFQIPGLSFSPFVDFIEFQDTIQAKTPTQFVTPHSVLIIQDGSTRAGYWDGNTSGHSDPTPDGYYNGASIGNNGTKIGLWMEWVGNRLWIANGEQIYASDIYDPLHFTELLYLSGGGSIQAMDGQVITGLKRSADAKQLLAFTAGNTTAIAAGITDRSTWSATSDFVRMLFPGVGCVAGKSIVDVGGEVKWLSAQGIRSYNAVGSTVFQAKNPVDSHEMQRSWDYRGPTLDRACGGYFDSYALWGMPCADIYNRHIWALDVSSNDISDKQLPEAWLGVWTGIRPVEFFSAFIEGEEMCMCLSQDKDAVRLWKLFNPKELDGGCRILSYLETKGNTFGPGVDSLLAFKQYSFAKIYGDAIFGNVEVSASLRNEYGCFKLMTQWELCALDEGVPSLTGCSPLPQSYEPQNRLLITPTPKDVCTVGGQPWRDIQGTSFVLRVTWLGRFGIDKIKHTAIQFQEPDQGTCPSPEGCVEKHCCDAEPEYVSCPTDGPSYYYAGTCDIASM